LSSHLFFVIHAATGFAVTLRCGAGSSVTLNPGDSKLIYADGVNVVAPN
jgi:hypothetical protein